MADNPMDTVIADAVDDAAFDASTPAETTPDTTEVAAPEAAAEPAEGSVFDNTAAEADAITQDEFEKRWGIPAKSVTGRENRIPHSRVKQMVSKAEAEAAARLQKEWEAKLAGERTPLETKVKDYESRLEKVAQFEHILENDPPTFLSMLSQVPAYREFFENYSRLLKQVQGQQPAEAAPLIDHSDMPQPDQTLSDGSKVYSLEGLAKRDEWLARKIEERAIQQAEERLSKRYAPIEQEWQQQQRYQQMVPVIEKQIAEARTWPNFAELEPEVIKLLKADQQLSLERAYVKAYQEHIVPKLTSDHNRVRTAILAELRQKPLSSSAPVQPVKPAPKPAEGRSMDDVIRDSLREAGLIS